MPSNRHELPRRSYWPRFKLSTNLVLVEIAAWAIAARRKRRGEATAT